MTTPGGDGAGDEEGAATASAPVAHKHAGPGAAQPGDYAPLIEMAEILRRIPHRYPFLLVDRAEEYRAFQSITGVKCVTVNEPFFVGHFPDNPVMPGVLICEAMAQTGAVLMSKSLNADVEGKTILFMSIDDARFRLPVKPGDVLQMKVEVLRYRGDVFKFRGQAYVGEKLAAQAEFAAMVVPTR